jgi:hypothetical protein
MAHVTISAGGITMAGYSRMFVIGGEGGFMGSDGVNPIQLLILVGDSDRMWLEPHYFDSSLRPLGQLRTLIPAGPDDPNALLDACIAFAPWYFTTCPSFSQLEAEVGDARGLDFDLDPRKVPKAWEKVREEGREVFGRIPLWRARLDPVPAGMSRSEGALG